MTWLCNSADDFVDEALAGFVAVHSRLVRRVDGGVVRATPLPQGRVAVVVGGGSGHYPAFAGLVGSGFAAGAVCGQVFTSPSAAQAERVALAAERGGGVLFLFGNYAGDVLHFGLAQERLRAAGVDTRTVVITDDIASAPAEQAAKRRGIAGDLVVFKIAGAAAEAGAPLDEVERLARLANDRTRTLGVAFGGCTLPGADAPLFEVPEGHLSIGLGIHGEPGVADAPLAPSKALARELVSRILADLPAPGGRAAVVVNGLGSVKYEELFVFYGDVAAALAAADVEIVEPECGELVTSLEMAGASLTVTWLDEELEPLWCAPAHTPAFTRGSTLQALDVVAVTADRLPDEARPAAATVPADPALLAVAPLVLDRLDAALAAVDAAHVELGRMDAVAGDGDHGTGMVRGLNAAAAGARAAVDAGGDAAAALVAAGDAWSERAGGTSGALWGAALVAAAGVLRSAGLPAPGSADPLGVAADAVEAALAVVRRLGGAEPGDKTMVDAFAPFAEALRARHRAGDALDVAWRAAAIVAEAAARQTAELRPRLGRARPLAERSIGHPDPGAISFALIARTVGDGLPRRHDRQYEQQGARQ